MNTTIQIESTLTLDLAKQPHLLIGGTTGSGKSVFINSLLLDLLTTNTEKELDLYIIDPKMVDYKEYKGLPHVKRYETEEDGIRDLLHKVDDIMMERYKALSTTSYKGIHEIGGYSHIVVIFDEYGSVEKDKTITTYIEHIARLGRAAGISLVLATQNPIAKEITSTLKANCPCRVAFRVLSSVNSRVILDESGAEDLRGNGQGILRDAYGNTTKFQGKMYRDTDKWTILYKLYNTR